MNTASFLSDNGRTAQITFARRTQVLNRMNTSPQQRVTTEKRTWPHVHTVGHHLSRWALKWKEEMVQCSVRSLRTSKHDPRNTHSLGKRFVRQCLLHTNLVCHTKVIQPVSVYLPPPSFQPFITSLRRFTNSQNSFLDHLSTHLSRKKGSGSVEIIC